MFTSLRTRFQPRFFTKPHGGQEIDPSAVIRLSRTDYTELFQAAVELRDGIRYSVWFPTAATRDRWISRLQRVMNRCPAVI